jgi:hypothetical protein
LQRAGRIFQGPARPIEMFHLFGGLLLLQDIA